MMSKKSKCIYAVLLSTQLWAVVPTIAQEGPVSPKDIQANWVGKTVVGIVASGPSMGKPVEFSMNADGSAVVSGVAEDTGSWRLSDQGYCVTWKKIRGGQERCFTVIRKGAELQVVNPDGSVNTNVTKVR